MSWVGVWGPCAALAPGSDVQNLVSRVLSASGVMCLAFRVYGLAWVMGTVLGLGPGSGVQLLVLGLLRGPGSGLQGLYLGPESVCGELSDGHWLQFNGSRSSRVGVWGRRKRYYCK